MTETTTAEGAAPHTPIEVERMLADVTAKMQQLRDDLAAARIAERDAKRAHEIAKVHAAADPWCPKVERGGATVGERQAWIDERVLDELLALQDATTLRQIASEALHSVHKELEALQSIGASVRASYRSPYS
jgi:hypothetical protein